MKKLTNQQKKDLVRFVVAGFAALLIHKSERIINTKADEYFGPDVEAEKKNKK